MIDQDHSERYVNAKMDIPEFETTCFLTLISGLFLQTILSFCYGITSFKENNFRETNALWFSFWNFINIFVLVLINFLQNKYAIDHSMKK